MPLWTKIQMNKKIKKRQIISSLFWKLLERGGTQGVQFIVQIVLARLLLPEDYGVIAIVSVFILLSSVFVQSGLNSALIQKKDADELDFSTVFYLSLFIAAVLYIIIFIAAPFISDFYNMKELGKILRILSITLFFGAFNSIQNAHISRNMRFKKLFISSLGAIVLSGILGIVAAYLGWGVWALVLQQFTNQLFVMMIMWLTVKWRPKLLFSFKRMKILYSYGWKILASSLINTLYQDIRTLIVGRIYSSAMLGYYNRGKQFPNIIVINIDGTIQSVMFPALSSNQDNTKRIKEMVRRSIVISSYIIFPLMVGLGVVAEPLVKIVLTEKWLPSVPFLQIFCASFALRPIHGANLQAIKALGRSDVFLKLEIIKKVLGTIILIISFCFNIYVVALGMALNGIIASFINAFPNKKLLDYSYAEQWKDMGQSLIMALVMGAIVFPIKFLHMQDWIILITQIVVGIAVYIALSKIFKVESYGYLISTIKDIFHARKNR